jgi:DUF1680 family protein
MQPIVLPGGFRSSVFAGLLAIAVPGALGAGSPVAPMVGDALECLPAGAVAVHGHLGEEIGLCLRNRVMAQNVENLVAPFRAREDVTEWRGEFWGKWITSAIEAYHLDPDPRLRAVIERGVRELVATQTADGYIGAYSQANRLQRWDVWGRKYTLLGLLAWNRETGDRQALAAARRLADSLLAEAGPGKGNLFRNDMWNGMASSSVLEPMVLLYRRTGDARYLAFCQWLVGEWRQPYGPDLERKALAGVPVVEMFARRAPAPKEYGDYGHSKAYEMMSCFEGLLELYRVTGERPHFDAARAAFDNIRTHEITVIGSGSEWERWADGARRQTEPWRKGMETCVTVTWMKFAAQLLRLTGEPRYADEIEITAYNALLGAQAPDGSWWCDFVTLGGTKERAENQCGMEASCCVANGPRGLMLLPQIAIMAGREGPTISLYGRMTATVPLAAHHQVGLEMESAYPEQGDVRIRLLPDQPAAFTLSLRIPAWSQGTRVLVNGEPQPGVVPGTYLPLARTWRAGDVVVLNLDLRPRIIRAPGMPRLFALARGPVVLARDRRLDPALDQPANALLAGNDPPLDLLPAAAHPATWMGFSTVLAGGGRVDLCDFASAGNTWGPDSRYRVWFDQP